MTAPSKAHELPVDDLTLAERRKAVRALLMRPILRAAGGDAEDLALVRKHAPWLREWFGKNLGWMLRVDSELARLGKIPAIPIDGTRPARDPQHKVPFTRARYVLFCLALACLERAERQTTLGNLARELRTAVAADPLFESCGISPELSTRESRKDLVHVIRLLIDLGVIVRIHGNEERYLAGDGDALYTIHRPAMAAILSMRRGPSSITATGLGDRISALVEEPVPDTEDGRNRQLRVQLMRKLVDEPVVYFEDLDPDERAYLQSQRPFLVRALEEGTGLLAETRAEGIALVDEEGGLTDLQMPSEGTEAHFTLLIAEHLSRRIKEDADARVGMSELEARARELAQRFGRYWRKDAREPGSEKPLLREALRVLESLALVRIDAEGAIVPRPAIARYSIHAEPPTAPDRLL